MKIYISIPITGHDYDEQARKAKAIAQVIEAQGHEAVSPFDTPPPKDGISEKEHYAYYMGADIERLLLCDGIYLTDGWRESRGCMLECKAAKIYGIDIIELRQS